MVTIIFDFDDTLFDTKRFNGDVVERFALHGVDKELARLAYNNTKINMGNYTLNGHITTLRDAHGKEIPKEFYDWFEGLDLTEYVLPQMDILLTELAQNHKLILLTKGEDDFQNIKITRSDLAKHFHEIHITPNSKELFFADKSFDDKVVFINDKEDENQKIKEFYPDFKVSQKYEKGDM